LNRKMSFISSKIIKDLMSY